MSQTSKYDIYKYSVRNKENRIYTRHRKIKHYITFERLNLLGFVIVLIVTPTISKIADIEIGKNKVILLIAVIYVIYKTLLLNFQSKITNNQLYLYQHFMYHRAIAIKLLAKIVVYGGQKKYSDIIDMICTIQLNKDNLFKIYSIFSEIEIIGEYVNSYIGIEGEKEKHLNELGEILNKLKEHLSEVIDSNNTDKRNTPE